MGIVLSIVVPTYNEVGYIRGTLDSIKSADLPFEYEVLVLDGVSNDGTLEILRDYELEWAELSVHLNLKTKQVYALNQALGLVRGDYVVRCDAHSLYPADYFKNLVHFLQCDTSGRFGNVGTAYNTTVLHCNEYQQGISDAMQHPAGIGGSHRSTAIVEGFKPVDTVLFGAWPRSVFDSVGVFDERFERGQDYEHNLRLRRAGFTVAQIPGEPFVYYTRSTFVKLAKMIFQYSYVKGQILCRDGRAPNVRSYVPAVALLIFLLLLSVLPVIACFLVAIYSVSIMTLGVRNYISWGNLRRSIGFCFAIPLMHTAHALGVLKAVWDCLVLRRQSNVMESTR